MELPTSWDALRKQARKLEAQLDEQMISYRKFVASKVDGTETEVESGIDRSIKQLQLVIAQMQSWISAGGSEVFSHTVTRHQEILQDLTQEFHRLQSSLRAKQEHASLIEDFMEYDRSRLDLEEGGGSVEQGLLKEHASISRSTGQLALPYLIMKERIVARSEDEDVVIVFTGGGKRVISRAMDNVISQAQATLGTLVFQRSTFGGINSKISNISSRLPTVNSLLSAIKRKKSMDTIILSLVASVCTFLILIYWISK